MEEIDLGACRGRWYAGDRSRVVVVLPGARYLPFAPLLWFSREVALSRGWSVLEVWDEYGDPGVDPWQWVEERAAAAVRHVEPARVAFVAKSIASHAARLAREGGLPGVWLTPLLHDPEVRAAFEELEAPALLVGGTGDRSWDGEAARRSGHEVLELERADHSLQIAGDSRASLEALRRVVERVDEFLGRL